MSYTCKRCNYTTDILCNFKSHLKRVTKCKVAPGMEDISCNVLLDEIIPQHIKTSYCCKYCQRYFNFQSGKSRHEKDCSEKNASKNSLKNIVINDFGFENTSYLDQEMLKDCLKELDLKKLIDQLHFNPDHPENHNFRLKNINKKIFVSVHDVFHSNIPSDEGELVIEFLHKNNIEYFSPLNYYHRNNLQKLRYNTNLDKNLVHDYTTNPCIFFILG